MPAPEDIVEFAAKSTKSMLQRLEKIEAHAAQIEKMVRFFYVLALIQLALTGLAVVALLIRAIPK